MRINTLIRNLARPVKSRSTYYTLVDVSSPSFSHILILSFMFYSFHGFFSFLPLLFPFCLVLMSNFFVYFVRYFPLYFEFLVLFLVIRFFYSFYFTRSFISLLFWNKKIHLNKNQHWSNLNIDLLSTHGDHIYCGAIFF